MFFVLISFPVFLFQFLFCYISVRKDKKLFKRYIIVLISFLILFVSISFLVNIGKEMSLSGFRTTVRVCCEGLPICVCASLSFGVEGGIWDLIVLVLTIAFLLFI